MICTYCNAMRPANEAPCPNCGGPSPLLGQSAFRDRGATSQRAMSWGSADTNRFSGQWNNQTPQASNMPASPDILEQASPSGRNQVPQMPFSAPLAPNSWGQFSPAQNSQVPQASFGPTTPANSWGELSPSMNHQWDNQVPQLSFDASSPQWGTPAQSGVPAMQEPPKSLLPVPYQGQMGLQVERPRDIALPMIQSPSLEQMLPALPEDSVYVPPMYTGSRPIIPRYRIFSGILSLFIVSLLVCGGIGYYAKTSGKLKAMGRAITGAAPASIQVTPLPTLPNPAAKPDIGPAYSKIPAATTTLHIDKNNTPLQPTRSFKTNQMFYLTFTVPNPGTGVVTAKWYMNNNYYRTTTIASIKQAQGMVNAWMSMSYATPAEGSVELDWNNQLAQRLYFVVQP